MSIQDIGALQRHFEALADYGAHLYQVAVAQGNEKAAALIREQWFRLRQGPVRTLVLGVSSAGKSTLINAMAGQIVVPEGKQTTSPIPVWVYRDDTPPDKPRIRLLRKDDIHLLNCGRFNYLTDYCYTATEAGRGTGQEKYRDLKAAVVDVDAPALAAAGVTLIDTPGIGVSEGDNARVREVLAEGCEMLIIVFMDLHQQEVKDYFTDLLAEEDAPLRRLLERGRVFLVLNATDEKHADDYAMLDARAHIRDAFDGWDGDDRLFAFNALDARLAACGVYAYGDLLPEGYSEEEMDHAAGTEAKERLRLPHAQPQEELDALCDALGMAVQDLCDSKADVAEILNPILQALEDGVRLLEQPYLDRIREIQNADYPVPPELERREALLRRRISGIREHIDEYSQLLSGGVDQSQTCQLGDALADRFISGEQFPTHLLMGSSFGEADKAMAELIQHPDGLNRWNVLLTAKLKELRGKLANLLTDRKTNPELAFWWDTFHRMCDYAETRTDGEENHLIPEIQTQVFRERMEFSLIQALTKGGQAVMESDAFVRTQAEREKIERYFGEKSRKIAEGSFLNGWRLFWLFADADHEILTPLRNRVVKEGTETFLTAFRQELWGFMPTLLQQYTAMLSEAEDLYSLLLDACLEEIHQAQEAARAADLEQVYRELAALNLRNPKLMGKE